MISCTLLIIGRIIGTDIFSTQSSILSSVGSVGASLVLWVLGFVFSFCGLLIWLELGTMFPRSGGEKVYLEMAYKQPKYLSTAVYAIHAILFGFSAGGCIVSLTGPVMPKRVSGRLTAPYLGFCEQVGLALRDRTFHYRLYWL